jgi:CHAT domain-containing protein
VRRSLTRHALAVARTLALVAAGTIVLAPGPDVPAATREATALATGYDAHGAPGPQVEALTRAIAIERAAPAPDADFLLWTTQRLAELHAREAPGGLGDRARAIALAHEALRLVDAAVVARAQARAVVIGPTPPLIRYQLLRSLAQWQLRRYEDLGDEFEARQGPISIDAPARPRRKWADQPPARALLVDAAAAARRALALERAMHGDDVWQPSGAERAELRALLTDILWRQGDWTRVFTAALDLHAAIYGDTYLQAEVSSFGRDDALRMLDGLPEGYAGHVALTRRQGGPRPSPAETGLFFKVLQAAATDEDSMTLDRVAVRAGAGDPALAGQLRGLQQVLDDYRRADAEAAAHARTQATAALAGDDKALTAPNPAIARTVRLRDAARAAWAGLAQAQPALAELVRTTPLEVREVQQRLRAGEALVLLHVNTLNVITWVVTPAGSSYVIHDTLGRREIAERVRALRRALDLTGVARLEDVPPFDAAVAHELYRALLGQAESLLRGARHLHVVLDPVLRSLPLGLLVTAPPARDTPHGRLPWLARRHAITVLPTVASLRSVALLRGRPRGPRTLIGFGDPVLTEAGRASEAARTALVSRGAPLASPEAVRALPALPHTTRELHAVARALGAPAADLHLREAAAERRVKGARLADYQVVYFATHALLPGDLGLTEPAVVLTPPAAATEEDDGLLTVSEIVGLRLNADWVVLSACNTTLGSGGRGLSGLARAFMFAGARALLVSSWAVESEATERLLSALFRLYSGTPTLGRAEALQRAMLEMIDRPPAPALAHPAFWAAFVVVGDGGR